MSFTKEQFDLALAEYQLFGPRRRIPIMERWRSLFPDADQAMLTKLKAQFSMIESFAHQHAESVRDNKTDKVSAIKQISVQYPFLSKAQVERFFNQAMMHAIM